MDEFRVTRTVPVLRIFSVEKAKEFYCGFLGFRIDWEHRFDEAAPLYLQVSRAGLALHLSEHHGDACPGATVFVDMTGLDAFHAAITAQPYGYYRPGIEVVPWGARQIEVCDPFGNRIRFNEHDKAAVGD